MKNGWQTKTLGEVCDIIDGRLRRSSIEAILTDGDSVRSTTCQTSTDRVDILTLDRSKTAQCRLTQRKTRCRCIDGDILFANDGHRQVHGIVDEAGLRSSIDQRLVSLRRRTVDAGFLVLLSSITDDFWQVERCDCSGSAQTAVTRQRSRERSRFPFPRSPNSSGSSASSTKRLRASPPPKPTPKRTSKTPAPSSKATSNPSSPSAARGGWNDRSAMLCDEFNRLSRQDASEDRERRSVSSRPRTSRRATSRSPMEIHRLHGCYEAG